MSKRKRKRRGPHTTLAGHKREGKKLLPPFAQLPNVHLTSWRDERLPEVLWAAVLGAALPRDDYLALFRRVADAAEALGESIGVSPEHSGLAGLSDADFDALLAPVIGDETAKEALGALLLCDHLPDLGHWQRHLQAKPEKDAIQLLATTVFKTTDHQSELSTDCRWLKVLMFIRAGRIDLPREMEEGIRGFPNVGDLRSVRPSIRAMESALRGALQRQSAWLQDFWKQFWRDTPCIPARRAEPEGETDLDSDALIEMYQRVAGHFFDVTENTDLDPRRDAVFGLVLYAINLVLALLQGVGTRGVEGRLAVRTLTECYVSLAFLMHRDEGVLWDRFRKYGSGQAKLAFLKLYELEDGDVPSYVAANELEALANEDYWQEFAEINLGNWAELDLRRMSEEAGAKDVYDKYYGWPSGYVHGQWGAIRDTVFHLCLNPLHRFHRIPSTPRMDMGSVAVDVKKLINLMLDKLNQAYPSFKPRLRTPKSGKAEVPREDDVASESPP